MAKKKIITEDQPLKITVKIEDQNGVVRVSFPATQQNADELLRIVNDFRSKTMHIDQSV